MTREESIEILQGAIKKPNTKDGYLGQAIDMAIKALEQEPRKGKWEYDAYKDKSGGHCNRCGHFLRYGEKTNFCPDCGADMKEVEQ